MSEYKPGVRTQVTLLGSFFVIVLPAVWFAAMGYMWFIEQYVKVDVNATPESVMDHFLILLAVLPMIPVVPAVLSLWAKSQICACSTARGRKRACVFAARMSGRPYAMAH